MNYNDADIAGIVLDGVPGFIDIFEREPVRQDDRRSEIIPAGGPISFANGRSDTGRTPGSEVVEKVLRADILQTTPIMAGDTRPPATRG